ncbi:MAG: hypothetical protein CL872_05705 [Dehalococcoidaceae bacterium]|nr:hypothetical protein [Dehalococcoidaceae bacterium]|tara:strand:- start:692 stop:910 length:219 start_codon:yes stop_codon:yes gene_type:complete
MPDGMFINVKINEKIRADLEMANKVVESCPVDIFIIEKDTLQTQEKYLDECTLCNLCIDAAGKENIEIIKLY